MITKTEIEKTLIALAGKAGFNVDNPSMPKDLYYAILGATMVKHTEVTLEQLPAINAVLQLLPKNESAMRQKLKALLTSEQPTTSTLGSTYMDMLTAEDVNSEEGVE